MTKKNSTAEREKKASAQADEENCLEESREVILSGRKARLDAVPPAVLRSYVEVNGKYYFAGRPDSLAFEDRGSRLKTTLSNSRVTGSMVDIAEAKGWTSIRVKGKEAFRREVWLHATTRGMDIKGYTPRDEDLARLKNLVRERPEKIREERPTRVKEKEIEKETVSSSLREENDEQKMNNARALLQEKDLVQLARENPELVNDIAAIKIGEKLGRNIPNKADRQRFMEKVRERVAENYLQGQPTPSVKIKEERTVEQPDRAKEVANER